MIQKTPWKKIHDRIMSTKWQEYIVGSSPRVFLRILSPLQKTVLIRSNFMTTLFTYGFEEKGDN